MAIQPIVDHRQHVLSSATRAADAKPYRFQTVLKKVLGPLASLRLTVGLMILAVFVILTFSFQLTRMDIWAAKSMHFPALLVSIPLQTFFPPSWFPQWQSIPGAILIPSGFLVLSALLVNLLAAHLTRFRIVGTGGTLAAGIGLLVAGTLLAVFVVLGGQNPDGFQAQPLVRWDVLWNAIQVALGVGGLGCVAWAYRMDRQRTIERALLSAFGLLLMALCGFLVIRGQSAFIGDSAMRIMWQLIQCGAPSLVLLAGARLVFGRKGGLVILHAGIAILMMNEIYTSLTAVEQRISFAEGETVNYAYDLRHAELAIVDSTSDPKFEDQTVIPVSRLQPGVLLTDPQLPVDVMCVRYAVNSRLRTLAPGDDNIATRGIGMVAAYDELDPTPGTGDQVDRPSAYVKVFDRQNNREIGTFLVSEALEPIEIEQAGNPRFPHNTFEVNGQTYQIALRFKRYYKPYRLTLLDTQQQTYLGTMIPRYFSSEFRLDDHETGVDVREKIWMNNPLRYRNETFYQSSYRQLPNGTELSELQVVRNSGWMIPYLCCVLVAVGLLAQFSLALTGFFKKVYRQRMDQLREAQSKKRNSLIAPRPWWAHTEVWLYTLIPAAILIWAVSQSGPRPVVFENMRLDELGRVPLVELGRAKPLESAARSFLRRASGYEHIKKSETDRQRTQPMVWMADVLLGGSDYADYELFRIDDPSLRNALNLEPRKGYRYTVNEISAAESELKKLYDEASMKPESQQATFENRAVKLYSLYRECRDFTHWFVVDWDGKSLMQLYYSTLLLDWSRANQPFLAPMFGGERTWSTLATGVFCQELLRRAEAWNLHTADAVAQKLVEEEAETVRLYEIRFQLFSEIARSPRFRAQMPEMSDLQWQAHVFKMLRDIPDDKMLEMATSQAAAVDGNLKQVLASNAKNLADELKLLFGAEGQLPPRAACPDFASLLALPAAYQNRDAAAFNGTLDKLEAHYAAYPPNGVRGWRLNWEEFYNRLAPNHRALIFYLIGFVFAAIGMVAFSRIMNQLSCSVMLGGAAIHLLGILLAIGISGRPPVKDLFSSFIFVTLGIVGIFLTLEWVTRLGIGNLLASLIGVGGLLWAANIAKGTDDTFKVIVAVLDTNFWLSTHVICVSLGYVATFASGTLGAAYILRGLVDPTMNDPQKDKMIRAIYGITCFALLFSFVGTVLGGLWADDSWGRFWGWDPKENGALMIVLWNAVLLHARWGGMVRRRGLAALAVLGNVVVAWSWEGVNQLGVGLHAYALSDVGKFNILLIFWASQVGIALLALIPERFWLSHRRLAEK